MKNINSILLALLIIIGGFIIYKLYIADESVTDKHNPDGGNSITVTNFEECVSAGNSVMESYPRKCAHKGTTYVEEIKEETKTTTRCPEEARGADFCIEIYKPVCGKVNILCFTEPCEPIYETFSNLCYACKNRLVESYTDGECI